MLYLAAVRLASDLRFALADLDNRAVWRIPCDGPSPEPPGLDDGGPAWSAFALREPDPFHAWVMEALPRVRAVRHSIRACALALRDNGYTGAGVDAYHALFCDLFDAPWLAGLPVIGDHQVELPVLVPNVFRADEMANAVRSLPVCPAPLSPNPTECQGDSPAEPINDDRDLDGLGSATPLELYERLHQQFKNDGVRNYAQAAHQRVEEITGETFAEGSLRVMCWRRRNAIAGRQAELVVPPPVTP